MKGIEQSKIDELSNFLLGYLTAVIVGKCIKCMEEKGSVSIKDILPENDTLSQVITEWLEDRDISILF